MPVAGQDAGDRVEVRGHAFVARVTVEERLGKQIRGQVRDVHQPLWRKGLIAAHTADDHCYDFVSRANLSLPYLIRTRLRQHETGYE